MKIWFKSIITSILSYQVKTLLARNEVQVIGITGSYGKTTTKSAIQTVLSQKFRVLAHDGNYNTEVGLPLSLFEQAIPKYITNVFTWIRILWQNQKKLSKPFPYEVVVLEMGADAPGDIANFMKYIKPDIGVVTAVAPVHTEGFGSVENILAEKWLLAEGSKSALVNVDFDLLAEKVTESALESIVTYGISQGDFRVIQNSINQSLVRMVATIVTPTSKLKVTTNLVGRHALSAVVASIAVATKLEMSATDIEAGVAAIKPFPGRMNPLPGLHGSVIIDDTYNASADTMIAALQALFKGSQSSAGRRLAILGSINELGSLSEAEHMRVGQECAHLDLLVTIGASANNYLLSAALDAGLPPAYAKGFNSPVEAGIYVASRLRSGDTVLVKGSQDQVFAEEATKLLLEAGTDRSQLVRQSESWLARKHSQFPDIQS